MSTWHGKPFEDKADGKEHSESQNEKQVIGSNQNNRPVSLSAPVQDVNKTRAGFTRFHFIGFTFHTPCWVDSKHNGTVETKSWRGDKEAAALWLYKFRGSVGGKFADLELYVITEVKPGRAGLVLGWLTATEYAVSWGPFSFAWLGLVVISTGDFWRPRRGFGCGGNPTEFVRWVTALHRRKSGRSCVALRTLRFPPNRFR